MLWHIPSHSGPWSPTAVLRHCTKQVRLFGWTTRRCGWLLEFFLLNHPNFSRWNHRAKEDHRPTQLWLSADTLAVIGLKAAAKNQNDHQERKRLQGIFKAKAKPEREVNHITGEVEEDLLHNKMGSVFRNIKLLSGSDTKPSCPTVHKKDGSACKSDEEMLACWQKHFEEPLNRQPGIPSSTLDNDANSTASDESTSVDKPTLEEVTSAIRKLKNGHAPRLNINPELLRCAVTPVAQALHSIFIRVWRSGRIPAEWRDGISVTIYTKTDCSSYRSITLLSIYGKVFAHVLLSRIQPLIDMTRRPQQSGFVADQSTIDAILALRLLSDIHREFNRPLKLAYHSLVNCN